MIKYNKIEFKKSSIIFIYGENAKNFFYIISKGSAVSYNYFDENYNIYHKKGDIIGLVNAAVNVPYFETVKAEEDTEVMEININELDKITNIHLIKKLYDHLTNVMEIRILYSLKDDGILAFATPNGYGISGRFNKNYFPIVPSDHAFEANPKSLDIFLSKYSLKCISLENQSIYYSRFCDIFNLKFISKNKLLSQIYNASAKKKNLGDTFECIYQNNKK